MNLNFEVLAEEAGSYPTKKNTMVNFQQLTLLDRSTENPMKITLDFRIEDAETARLHAGKLRGKTVTIGMTDLRVFNGRYQILGKFVSVVQGK